MRPVWRAWRSWRDRILLLRGAIGTTFLTTFWRTWPRAPLLPSVRFRVLDNQAVSTLGRVNAANML